MRKTWLAFGLTALFGSVTAAPPSPSLEGDDRIIMNSAGFLAAHPDLLNRSRGWEAYRRGAYDEAQRWFRMAARYADKPSQAMVAEMLWKGEGAMADAPLAYAWMDLAAEHGYPGFVAMRERYWDALDTAQRVEAVARGEAVYTEFGDTVAKPRIATVLRRERRRTTGSRLGFVGNLRVEIPGPGGLPLTIDGHQYYAEKFWDPEAYQAWHDATWQAPRRPNVDIGDVEQVREPPREE